MAEDEGVPRQAFGMHKRAGAALIEAPWSNLWRAFNNLSLEYRGAIAATGFSAGARAG